jgi:hypothetical protein
MEPTDMDPDDARYYIEDLYHYAVSRLNKLPKEHYDPEDLSAPPLSEKGKQHYGEDTYQLLSGMAAALEKWDESGEDVQELKDEYGGTFIEGVKIGKRLAVYEGRDFNFTAGEVSNSDDSKFTFTQ